MQIGEDVANGFPTLGALAGFLETFSHSLARMSRTVFLFLGALASLRGLAQPRFPEPLPRLEQFAHQASRLHLRGWPGVFCRFWGLAGVGRGLAEAFLR